jgi:cold shock CspA family protein
MAEFFSKRDREKKKQQARKEKDERKRERKENSRDGNSLAQMMAYVDENGNLTSIPQDHTKRREVSIDEIQIGVPKGNVTNSIDNFDEGVITHFNFEKGFGFIRDSKTKQSIFVHNKQLSRPVQLNDKVKYIVRQGIKGLEATEVSIIN